MPDRVFGAAFSALLIVAAPRPATAQDHKSWRDYGGASDSAQYSALAQINRSNVSKLEVAWTYPTGDNNKYFFNPLVVDIGMSVLAKVAGRQYVVFCAAAQVGLTPATQVKIHDAYVAFALPSE